MEEFNVRQLKLEDWLNFKNIRLEALKNHPREFCPSRDETKFSKEVWQERLGNSNGASFGLFNSTGEIIGLTGIIRENNESKSRLAHLVGSYIRAEYRGQGLSKMFYETRLNWAKDQKDIDTLVVEIVEENLAVQEAHKKFGFQPVGSREHVWPNSEKKGCLVYHLDIHKT